ncbi:MAG TPA: glycosyl transferase, partial [Burkholderiales bacterium]|nr:glycosyl transferase [Burkholderiales bacterium]
MIALVFLTKGKMTHIALDRPNERSLHMKPVPRTGGIAILLGILGGWALCGMPPSPLLVSLLLLAAVSFLDDLIDMPVPIRFGTHVLASLIFSASVLPHSFFPVFASTIAFVWMINLYNFMDGSDGLA